MESESKEELFRSAPAWKALAALAVPTIIAQIVIVIYNMTDTWFVGLRNNPAQVAALSLCLPVYTMLTAISNLFGIGAAALISRALGAGDTRKANRGFLGAVMGTLIVSVAYAVLMLVCGRFVADMIGADASDLEYSVQYILYAIVIGGVPTIFSAALGQLVRAYGVAKEASFGMILGAVTNIILDPVFIFVLFPEGMEVTAASLATACTNLISTLYFVILAFHHRNQLTGELKLNDWSALKEIPEIIKGGLPGFLMVALAMLSNCILNSMISSLGTEAVAGLGVVRKIDQLAYAFNQGITQGMLPLIGFCFGAGLYGRMRKVILEAGAATELFSLLCMTVSLIFAPSLIRFFIQDAQTVLMGSQFLRILCLAIPIYSLTFVVIAAFQAAGEGVRPVILSILHKGSVDIVLYFVIGWLFSLKQILWAAPLAEGIALVLAICMFVAFIRRLLASHSTAEIQVQHH